jgi:TfoX/Sxy family transcriptional regulator of competence genes
MAYDEDLANRIREVLGADPGVEERRMFGGLAFLVDGHMAVAASGRGGLMVRVDPADAQRHLAGGKAEPMVMSGREMKGWLRVDTLHVRTTRDLTRWVHAGVSFVRTLPPKTARRKRAAEG